MIDRTVGGRKKDATGSRDYKDVVAWKRKRCCDNHHKEAKTN
ncbi:MAG: hypothetical protein R2756_04365 [Bacteroidales bacterium]